MVETESSKTEDLGDAVSSDGRSAAPAGLSPSGSQAKPAAAIAETIDRAAGLLEAKGWTQGAFARDRDGRPVSTGAENAACFCAAGAIIRASTSISQEIRAIEEVFKPCRRLTVWNDAPGRTQAEVVDKLREAASKAREQGL